MTDQGLTVRAVDARLVRVPMRRPLHTSADTITHAPLVLLDLHTHEGVTGRAYLFCYREGLGRALVELVRDTVPLLVGRSAQPDTVRRTLAAAFRLAGTGGTTSMLFSGLDMACWDALAVAAGLPLVRLLGAEPRPVPAYNSNGLGLAEPAAVAEEAGELLEEGMPALKVRLGRPVASADVATVEAVRDAVGDDVDLMVDFNQALTLPDALARCRELDDRGPAWIEEPVRHDDYAGAAELAAALRTPIQIGENFAGPRALATAVSARASDLVMPDPDRIGGITGWRDSAALADVAGIPVSSHLYPEVSAHLLAATPTAHWLEYVDWAAPILRAPLDPSRGTVTPPETPGVGIDWDEDAVARYRVA